MRNILLISFLITLCGLVSKSTSKIELRNLYYQATIDEEVADTFFWKMKDKSCSMPFDLAYKGMAYMLQAKYAWSPYSKYSYFIEGRDLLEQAITKDSTDIEIRFLRFCIQSNAPFFLDYSDKVSIDFLYIKNNWSSLKDKDLKERIVEYMQESDDVNESDKKIFK